MKLTIRASRGVRKAVIPAAGFGTRLFPATKAIKKELFPVIDSEGRAKPAILAIIEEALSAGIEEIALIVQSSDREIFEDFLHTQLRIENFNKLSKDNQQYSQYLSEVGHRVTFIVQDIPEGFGHAVYCAREWVGNEPFLLLLGDHLSISENETSCARQLMEAFTRCNQSMVGLKVSPASEIGNFGCVTGVWDEKDSLLNVSEITEKPEIEYAREHLQVEGMNKDSYLTLFGQYILKPRIFDCLEEKISHNIRERGEFQLTSSIDRLRQEDGLKGCLIQGKAFDIGQPEAYLNTIVEYSKRRNTGDRSQKSE
ncbi:MAG: UTP--glucose-1-phosphate uridylyltransferase [bacterium]|nr:UTP--glucose-1-phosphate uridylyltransferase [bacterium]